MSKILELRSKKFRGIGQGVDLVSFIESIEVILRSLDFI